MNYIHKLGYIIEEVMIMIRPIFFKYMTISFLILLVLTLLGCEKKNTIDYKTTRDTSSNVQGSIIDEPGQKNTVLTPEEKAYLQTFIDKGSIHVAIRPNKLTYHVEEDGSITGFHYEILKTFLDEHDLELEITECLFNDFFKIDGVIPENVETDPSIIYSPELLEEVDFALSNLTILPWREKLMRFVKVIPSRELIVTRKGETIESLDGMLNKKVSVALNTSHHQTLMRIQEELGQPLNLYVIDEYYDMVKIVSEGHADVTVFDSDRIFYEMEIYGNIDVSMAVSDLQDLSWAVKKDNILLANILQKHIEKLRVNGSYNDIWKKYYGIDINDYLKIINYSETK